MYEIKKQFSFTRIGGANGECSYKSSVIDFSLIGQTTYEELYDRDGNVIENHSYTYNEDGFLTEEKKDQGQPGQCVHYFYEYDEFGRIMRKERKRKDKTLMITTYEIQEDREVETTTGPSGLMISKIDRLFDEMGRVTELIEFQENDTPLYRQKFSYDLDGNLTMAEYFDEQGELMELHIRDFDEIGHVVRFEKQDSEGEIIENELLEYSEEGFVISKTTVNSKFEYEFNELGLEVKINEYTLSGEIVTERSYEYDALGNLEREKSYDHVEEQEVEITYQYEFYAEVVFENE